MSEIIRVLRVLEYIGPRHIVEQTLRRGGVPANGEHTVTLRVGAPYQPMSETMRITSALIGAFGEVVQILDEPTIDASADETASVS